MADVVASTYLVVVGMVVFHETLPKNGTALGLRLGGFAGVLLGSILVASGGGETSIPPPESDLGLGTAFMPEIDLLGRHPTDRSLAGAPPEQPS